MSDQQQPYVTVFNSALETGVRSLVILTANFPDALDLQRLVDFDYLVVHSGDVGGPESLHPPLPMREGELLVRRRIIESGLSLMMSRGLITRIAHAEGIVYQASDYAKPFVDSLATPYMLLLIEKANWVATTFSNMDTSELHKLINGFFDKWTTQFHPSQGLGGG
ncbi:putative threonine efflux protein [Hahella chejuensis KCTC 2396]|uniref:Putative threonine efflux protein n=1 Tax=Hahella chejuensis (strain KCTC 2396) TaxID=349521 RepID=Q2SKK3_HAHCH|nr:ABC-three component system middle component 2 [Hahella chejuensis]ABC28821.1 putative threonine efflux protein [Hahella chejuensis KCTC 2396]